MMTTAMTTTPDTSNLRTFLERVVEWRLDDLALVDSIGRLTYQEFNENVDRAANVFTSCGITQGDRVAIMLPNCREYLYAWFGLAKIGAIHVAVNPRLSGSLLRHQLTNCDPSMAVVGSRELEAYANAAPEWLSGDRLLVCGSGSQRLENDFPSKIAEAPTESPPERRIDPSDPVAIMYTSGTTGPAKGVVNCHKVYTRVGTDLRRLMGLRPSDRMYVFLPLCHGNPQMMGVMPTLAAGGTIALAERFSASKFWYEIREFDATVFTHIGSPLSILMKSPEREGDGNNPLRLILGGAPVNVSRAFGERFGCKVLDGWGMIEVGCNTTITPLDDSTARTNGKARECFDVRIVDEYDREVAPGVAGEIVVRPLEPDVMFSEYFRMPERTLKTFRNLWFHTGDYGKKDSDGHLYFLGRSEDAIRRKGENISPSDIESVLALHPSVAEAAVIGVPDELAGQEIMACIVGRKPEDPPDPREIVAWCVDRLPDFMTPRYITFKPGLEKTASEKIQRFKLREEGARYAWDRQADQPE